VSVSQRSFANYHHGQPPGWLTLSRRRLLSTLVLSQLAPKRPHARPRAPANCRPKSLLPPSILCPVLEIHCTLPKPGWGPAQCTLLPRARFWLKLLVTAR